MYVRRYIELLIGRQTDSYCCSATSAVGITKQNNVSNDNASVHFVG